MKKAISLMLVLSVMLAVFVFPVSAEEGAPNCAKVVVTTENGNGVALQKEDGYVNAVISITDESGSTVSDDVSFKVRGNSTALPGIKKKAFTFKLSKKKELLGMKKGKKWALLANAFDPTLLRNFIALDTAKKLRIPYASDQRVVELWLDGSFRGCYNLVEPIDVKQERLNLNVEENEKDFLIEIETSRQESGATYFKTNGIRFLIKEPETPDETELSYIQSVMDGVIDTIITKDEAAIREKIDVDSFLRFYLFNEFFKPVDFDFSSVFYYYKNGKLFAGPPWDYDLSAGNENVNYSQTSKNAYATDGLFISARNLYRYLCACDWFNDQASEMFFDNAAIFDDVGEDGGVLDSLSAQYQGEFDRNFTETGWKVWWTLVNVQRPADQTYEENYSFLKNWYRARFSWLCEHFGVEKQSYIVGDANGNRRLEISDATTIQMVLASLIEDEDGMIALRANGSNAALNISNATFVQRWLAKFSDVSPVGETRNLYQRKENQ